MAAYRQAKRMQRGASIGYGENNVTGTNKFNMPPISIGTSDFTLEYFGNAYGSTMAVANNFLFQNKIIQAGASDIGKNDLYIVSLGGKNSKILRFTAQNEDEKFHLVIARKVSEYTVTINNLLYDTVDMGEVKDLGNFSPVIMNSSDVGFVRVWNYALSADEIATLYNNGDPMGYVVPKASRYFERSYHSNFTEGTDGWGIAGGSPNLSVVSNGGILELSGNYDAYQIMRAVGDAPKYASKYKVRIELEERISLSSFLFFPFSTTTFVVGSFSEPTDVLEGVTNKPSDTLSRNCYLYIYGLKPNDLVRIKSISVEPIGLLAEYLPQNLMEYPNAGDLDVLSPNSYTWTGPDDSNYGISIPLSGYITAKKCVVTIEVSNYEAGAPFFKISTSNSTSIPQQNGTFELEQIILGDAYNRVAIYGGNEGTDRRMTITVKGIRQINGISYSWLDSAKQMPLSDEYMEPLFQPIGGYDMAANGAPEILYNE